MADGVKKFDSAAHIDAAKKAWLERQEVYKKMYYRKSKYPPMSIEPFPHERQRLPFQMTTEDRALRQQWLRDQALTPREPRYVPELTPRNFFRRFFGTPWDAITKVSTPAVGLEKARGLRYLGPKVGMFFAGIFIIADYFTHNRAHWEMTRGWNMYGSRLAVYPDQEPATSSVRTHGERHCGDFNDRGFSKRTALTEIS